METLLLVGAHATTESLTTAEGHLAPRGPSLKGAFERAGYTVVNADDAAGALARLGQQPPDLIVVAGTVPDMELLALCTALRHDPAAEKTPFVVVADAARHTGPAASRTGADLVFPPTVGPVEIADRLQHLF